MKKVFFSILFIFVSMSAFANIEFDMNLTGIPFENLKNGNGIEYRPGFPFGFENQWGIFFYAPLNFMELGINASYGVDFIFSGDQSFPGLKLVYEDNTVKLAENSVKSFDFKFGIESYATLGPVARFNIGKMHSISVSPGVTGFFNVVACREEKTITFEFKNGLKETKTEAFTKVENGTYLAFTFDVAYKYWLIQKENFDFGFDAGYEFGLPLFGEFEDSSINIGGTSHKLYLGVAFNFCRRRMNEMPADSPSEDVEWDLPDESDED